MASAGVPRLEERLVAGVEFLLDRQGPDGLWRDFETLAGEASDWPTGFIGAQLADAGVRGPAIDAAARAVLRDRHRDGGWGYHRHVPTDADSTAWCLTFLAVTGAERDAADGAARCLRRFQDGRTGGIRTYADPRPVRRYLNAGVRLDLRGWCSPHLEVSATAARALARVPGGRFLTEVELAWRYVEQRQAADGGWDSYWWVDRHYPTAQAALLAETLGHREPSRKAAGWVRSEQLEDGLWGAAGVERSAFATASSLTVLLQSGTGGAARDVHRGLLSLVGLQQPDGGWPGDAAMRIPPPGVVEPADHESWRVGGLGTGVVVRDQHRLFTTAACIAPLALAAAGSG